MKMDRKYEFEIKGRKIEVYPSEKERCPVIYLNSFSDENEDLYNMLCKRECPDFNLVSISNLDFDKDMAPWDSPQIFKNRDPFKGGADQYLKLLTQEIMPEVEKMLSEISWRGIAGYSLAGLFALYSLYRTDVFSSAASMSGSLWYPGFREYVMSHEMKKKPDCIYLSLGGKESNTKNAYMKSVQENTEIIFDHYENSGIDTCYKLNEGNHFVKANERTADGIEWLLKHKE